MIAATELLDVVSRIKDETSYIPTSGYEVRDIEDKVLQSSRDKNAVKFSLPSAAVSMGYKSYNRLLVKLKSIFKIAAGDPISEIAKLPHDELLKVLKTIITEWAEQDVETPPIVDLEVLNTLTNVNKASRLSKHTPYTEATQSPWGAVIYPVGYPTEKAFLTHEEATILEIYGKACPIKIPYGTFAFCVGDVFNDESYIRLDSTVALSGPKGEIDSPEDFIGDSKRIILIKDTVTLDGGTNIKKESIQ